MAKPVPYDDNVHYVKAAGPKDRHPMKWIVRSHKEAQINTSRRAPTLDEAIELAKRITKQACEKSRNDLLLFHGRTEKPEKKATPREESFSISHFSCICANPVAQVWQCAALPDEKKTGGRPAKEGTQKKAPRFKHVKGECAVLLGSTPVRDPDGSIRVFKNWQEAEEYTYELYCQADELGETITWREGSLVVDRLTNVEIIFDPVCNGAYRPFSLWFPKYSKPYYMQVGRGKGRSSSVKSDDGITRDITSLDSDGQRAHAFNRRIDRMVAEDANQHQMTMQVATFRSIVGAEKMALQLEREYFRNADYMN